WVADGDVDPVSPNSHHRTAETARGPIIPRYRLGRAPIRRPPPDPDLLPKGIVRDVVDELAVGRERPAEFLGSILGSTQNVGCSPSSRYHCHDELPPVDPHLGRYLRSVGTPNAAGTSFDQCAWGTPEPTGVPADNSGLLFRRERVPHKHDRMSVRRPVENPGMGFLPRHLDRRAAIHRHRKQLAHTFTKAVKPYFPSVEGE